ATLTLFCIAPTLFADDTIHIDAGKLYADYEKNAVAADKKYKEKVVIVSGTIDRIDKDLFGNTYARLRVNDLFGVQCNFAAASADQLAKARTKMHAVIKGKVMGRLGNVIVTECSFAK